MTTMPLGRPLRAAVATVVAVAGVAIISGCGSTKHSATNAASACGGAPVPVMTIGDVTLAPGATGGSPVPELGPSVQAAVANVNSTCQLGRPVKLTVCNSQFNPNQTSTCAREAVSDHVAAVIGAWTAFGDNYMPVIASAGIPSLGNAGVSSSEATGKLSFPTWNALASLVARVTLAGSTGKKHMVAAALDVPAVSFELNVMRSVASKYGMTVSVVNVPATATDMSSYAGQAISSGPDAIALVLGTAQSEAFLKSAEQQGLNLAKTPVYDDISSINSHYVHAVGAQDTKGMLLSGEIMSPTDTAEPAVKRYEAELKAAGQTVAPVNQTIIGLNGWGTMHMFADLMQGSKTIDAKTVAAKLSSMGLTDWSKYGIPPLDFATPAFSGNPLLAKFRLFSQYTRVYRMGADGVPIPLTHGWVSLMHKITLSQ